MLFGSPPKAAQRIAAGLGLSVTQDDIVIRGHAIECRINAEDPKSFLPCPGKIDYYHAPGGPGVRLDTHVYSGYKVPPHYDSLLAKLICYGNDRAEALARARKQKTAALTKKVVLPGLNHLLVPAKTGEVDEYPRLGNVSVSPDVTNALSAWLKKTFAAVK